MKMRSKRAGALRSTGGGRYEQEFGAPPPPPRPCSAAPASNGAVQPPTPTPTPPRPQQTDDEPVAGFDVTALPRRLPAPDYHQIHYSVARLEPEGPPLRREANDLRRGPLSYREKESLRVARRFDAERRHPPAVDAAPRRRRGDARVRPRRGGDGDPRQREPNPQGGTVVAPRRVDAVRRGAADPGRAVARADVSSP